jgi:hypothetical protein
MVAFAGKSALDLQAVDDRLALWSGRFAFTQTTAIADRLTIGRHPAVPT